MERKFWLTIIGLLSTGCSATSFQEPLELNSKPAEWRVIAIASGHPKLTTERIAAIGARMSFNVVDSTLTAFDGCANVHGTFKFEEGKLYSNPAPAPARCPSEDARIFSRYLHNMLTNGVKVGAFSAPTGDGLLLDPEVGQALSLVH